jgi:hypothetical protein
MRKLYPDLASISQLYYLAIKMTQDGKLGYHVIAVV